MQLKVQCTRTIQTLARRLNSLVNREITFGKLLINVTELKRKMGFSTIFVFCLYDSANSVHILYFLNVAFTLILR